MSILNEIGLKHGTDKASTIHDYLRKYEKYLLFKRESELKILEIGVLNNSSLKTWKEYFYNSKIVGIDINTNCTQYSDDRITVEIGDQSNKFFLEEVIKKHGPFDFIVDDGSHMVNHVIYSFEHLFDSVKSGGQYIVEDACTSYWEYYGGGVKKIGSTIEHFKNIIDEVNFYGEMIIGSEFPFARRDDQLIELIKNKKIDSYGETIESINFLNSIIIINKR